MTSRRASLWSVLKPTWTRFREHGDLLSAATSFYALLSLAPLFMISIGVAGLVFDRGDARASMLHALRRFASARVADVVRTMLEAAEQNESHVAAALATVFLLWGASRLFVQVQEALNLIWGVRLAPSISALRALRQVALKRLLSIAMVVGCGALLLGTLALQAMFSVANTIVHDLGAAMDLSPGLLIVEQQAISLLLLTLVFGIIFRVLPDAEIHWRDVWVGAAITAALMVLGTWLFGKTLSLVSPAWLQGAIGSVAAFVVWVFYAAQVFFLGAAFTRSWACRDGKRVRPEPHYIVDPMETAPSGTSVASKAIA